MTAKFPGDVNWKVYGFLYTSWPQSMRPTVYVTGGWEEKTWEMENSWSSRTSSKNAQTPTSRVHSRMTGCHVSRRNWSQFWERCVRRFYGTYTDSSKTINSLAQLLITVTREGNRWHSYHNKDRVRTNYHPGSETQRWSDIPTRRLLVHDRCVWFANIGLKIESTGISDNNFSRLQLTTSHLYLLLDIRLAHIPQHCYSL